MTGQHQFTPTDMNQYRDDPIINQQPIQHPMDSYFRALDSVNRVGVVKPDRTGTGTKDMFGAGMAFDLKRGFPLLNLRKINFSAVVAETLWFLNGSTDINFLKELGCSFWNAWANEDGSIGPMYGEQWRRSKQVNGKGEIVEVDQIKWLIDNARKNPYSRRLIVDSWQNALLPPDESTPPKDNVGNGFMALAPCHNLFQVVIDPPLSQKDPNAISLPRVNLKVNMRSCDIVIGAPHNIASYALIQTLLANELGMDVGWLKFDFGSLHQYANHEQPTLTMISRFIQLLQQRDMSAPTLNLEQHMNLTWAMTPTPDKVYKIATALVGYKPFDKIDGIAVAV